LREAVAITEREALKLKVIDLRRRLVPDLLEKIDGRYDQAAKGHGDARDEGRPGAADRDRLSRTGS